MKAYNPKVSLVSICGLLGFTRQAYYQHFWHWQEKTVKQDLVLQQVRQIRSRHPSIGVRKLHVMLQDFLIVHQIKMGRDALFDLLAAHYMLIRKRRRKVYTTDSGHWLRRYPNLIRDLEINRVNQVWVSDITYLKTQQGFLYISLITDAHSHKIVGYNLADNLESINAVKALGMALKTTFNGSSKSLIHHSDQGFQYCSELYINLLKKNNIDPSMSDKGKPLQNSIAERINGILKYEYLYHHDLKTKSEAEKILKESIEKYNTERPHMSCTMLTPEKAHLFKGKLIKQWKNYYKKQCQPVNV